MSGRVAKRLRKRAMINPKEKGSFNKDLYKQLKRDYKKGIK